MPFRMLGGVMAKASDEGAYFQMVMRNGWVALPAQSKCLSCRFGLCVPTGAALFVHAKWSL